MSAGTLICHTDAERRRLEDLRLRFRRVSPVIVAMYLAAGATGVGAHGWQPLLPVVVAAAVFAVIWTGLARYERPEYALVGVWLLAELAIAGGIALAHGPRASLLPVLVMPTVLILGILPGRTVLAVIAITEAVVLGVAFGFDSTEILHTPPVLLLPVVLIVVLAGSLAAMRDLDIASRRGAVVDQLTGVLNRGALTPRVAELEHQASKTGEQVAVIAIDVDHFKAINDRHGHAAGDLVLCEVARRLDDCLSQSEPIYRFGGEEFVVVIAGIDHTEAQRRAERMRLAVARRPIGDIAVTISLGVAASPPGRAFAFEDVFARADEALYAAKRGGRDRVGVAGSTTPTAAAQVIGDVAAASADEVGQPPPRGRRRRQRDLALLSEDEPGAHQVSGAPHPEGRRRGNWLVTDPLERDHFIELNTRLTPVFVIGGLIAFAGVAASGPWFGWATLGPPIAGAAVFMAVQNRAGKVRHSEYGVLLGWLVFELSIAGGFAVSHGAPLFALPLLLIMVPGLCAVFPGRGVLVAVAFAGVLVIVVAFALNSQQVLRDPAVVTLPLALLGTLALVGWTVGRSAVGYRGASVVDQLTGMLNRSALRARVAETEARSVLSAEQVAVIIGDVDHFKAINDRYGHAAGDAVLVEVAYRMRKCLRAFESAYRIGGEEFAILLPGIDQPEAIAVAERLRLAVRDAAVNGLAITMSFGVVATAPDEPFSYETVFASADAALYRAKQTGRDRVCADGAYEPAELVVAAA